MLLPLQHVAHHARQRAARTRFEEHAEAVRMHPPDRLVEPNRHHPLVRRRLPRLPRLERQRRRAAARVDGDLRLLVHPAARELVDERQDLPAPRRVERAVHLQAPPARARRRERLQHRLHRLRRDRERPLLRRERERPLHRLRREGRKRLLGLLGMRREHRHERALRQTRVRDGGVHHLVGLAQELAPASAVELPPEEPARDEGVQVAAREAHRAVRTNPQRLQDAHHRRVRRIGRDDGLRVRPRREHVRVVPVVGRGGEDEVGRLEEPASRQRRLQLVERQTAFPEAHREVAQHVRVEGRRTGEDEREPPPRFAAQQVAPEVVGAALVSHARAAAPDAARRRDEPPPQVGRRMRHEGQDGLPVLRERLRARVRHVAQRHARRLVEEPHQAVRRRRQRIVVRRA